jgi:hypothetical protein
MPAEPRWLLRVPRIIDELSALPAPVVDRSVIERVFGVRRRRAIYLLGGFGGYQVGRTFVIERETLIGRLRAIAAGESFHFERRRHQHLTEGLERLRRNNRAARISLPVPSPAPHSASLPDGVELEPGRLVIHFAGGRDLLAKLYGIAQAAAEDFDRFEASTRVP